MSRNQVYLITGASRGIGRGLVATLLLRPATTVVAAVRDTSTPSSQSLTSLPVAADSKLVTVKLDSSVTTDAQDAITRLMSDHGLDHIDVLIANTGINNNIGRVLETAAEDMRAHFEINAIAPLLLFQAALPLLEKSKQPKFIAISSSMGSISEMEPLKGLAYGASKSALNYIARKIHWEHENLVSVALHPGWVQTEMGDYSAEAWGFRQPPITLDDSVKGVLQQMDKATRAESSPMISFDGTKIGW